MGIAHGPCTDHYSISLPTVRMFLQFPKVAITSQRPSGSTLPSKPDPAKSALTEAIQTAQIGQSKTADPSLANTQGEEEEDEEELIFKFDEDFLNSPAS